jgi:hypothetical protein
LDSSIAVVICLVLLQFVAMIFSIIGPFLYDTEIAIPWAGGGKYYDYFALYFKLLIASWAGGGTMVRLCCDTLDKP